MAKKGTKKVSKKAKTTPFDVFELQIPRQHYPKRKGNKSRDFAEKTKDSIQKLHDIELDLEFHLKNIKNAKAILFSKKRASRPMNRRYLNNVVVDVEKFNNEYENYCLRVYIHRETLWQFIAEFLDIKDKTFYSFLEDSKIRDIGITKVLSAFDKNSHLKEIIKSRNHITHKLQGGGSRIREKNIDDLIEKFNSDLKCVNRSLTKIVEIQNNIANKINNYKK